MTKHEFKALYTDKKEALVTACCQLKLMRQYKICTRDELLTQMAHVKELRTELTALHNSR